MRNHCHKTLSLLFFIIRYRLDAVVTQTVTVASSITAPGHKLFLFPLSDTELNNVKWRRGALNTTTEMAGTYLQSLNDFYYF